MRKNNQGWFSQETGIQLRWNPIAGRVWRASHCIHHQWDDTTSGAWWIKVMQRIQSLLASNISVTSITLVFDRYDLEISIKKLEWDRRTGRETTPTYGITGRRRVPNYRKFMKNITNKSALAEFICIYLTETAPHILKEHQWITLAGGFNDG